MADIKNIRFTDFIQGLQEEDTLDYPNNAVRAGSNVTLAETIQTRGGLSTVDSVGLPANSEIMALAQVKFPTNEKTYLVAQVKTEVSNASAIELQPDIDPYLNTSSYRQGLYLFGGTESGGDGGTDRELSFLSIVVNQDTTPIFAIDFNVGLTDSTGNNGTATEIDSIEGYGVTTNEALSQDVYRAMYEGPYLYYADADAEIWSAAIQDETLNVEVVYKDTGTDSSFTKRWPIIAYYDGTDWFSAWFNPISDLPGSDGLSGDAFSTTKTASYYVTDEDFLLGTKNLSVGFTIPTETNVHVFTYNYTEGYSPYLQASNIYYLGSGTEREIRISGTNLSEVQVFIGSNLRLHLAFGDNGLTDLSGIQGEGALSSGEYADILNEDGSITTGEGVYIYFPSQVDSDWFANYNAASSVRYRVKCVVGSEASSCVVYGYKLGSPTTNRFTFAMSQYGAECSYNTAGEIAWNLSTPIWYAPLDSIMAIDIIGTDQIESSPLWDMYVSASYVGDTPGETTYWSLYAMPDTLPDTGA